MKQSGDEVHVAISRELAERFQIRPGDHLECIAEGNVLRLVPADKTHPLTIEERLRLFDETTARIRSRAAAAPKAEPPDRGWTREDLYTRGGPR